MRKWLLIGAMAVGLMAPLAHAQTVNQLTANSSVRVANQPGGTDGWMAVDTIRNGARFITTTQTGAATSIATGGTLMWVGTAPTTWAVTLPAAGTAYAGELVTLATDTTLTTMVTVTAGAGNTLHATYASQTLTALTPVIFQYQLSSKTWFRIQ